MSTSEKKSMLSHPIFLIGVVDFSVKIFWLILIRIYPEWYQFELTSVLQLISSSAVLLLCAIFVKDKSQRTILIVLIFALAVIKMATPFLTRL